jgi:NAD(P)-dependent dehydrogenase (short-subunit alcohol dehydrogenase family)
MLRRAWLKSSTKICLPNFSKSRLLLLRFPIPDSLMLAGLRRMNTFAPLLTLKHFSPLLQSTKTLLKMDDDFGGLLPKQHNLVASLSARVGSISENQKGGWYSYRASKAAQNQITRTVSLELMRKNVPTICVGLHPGTVRTQLSKDFTGGPGGQGKETDDEHAVEARRKKGEFEASESASLLTGVMSRLKEEDSGFVWDYSGKKVPF